MHCMLLLQCCVTPTHARTHAHTRMYIHTYLTDSRSEALGILECLQQGRGEEGEVVIARVIQDCSTHW